MRNPTDVIVVGGGMAGLAAAERLVRAGCDVVVLEGRDTVGGRVETLRTADGPAFESGAQGMNGDMRRVLERVRALGLTLVPLPTAGRPGLDGFTADDSDELDQALEALHVAAFDLSSAACALAADPRVSLATLLGSLRPGPGAAALADSLVAELWGRAPADLQLAHVLAVLRSYGSPRDDWEFALVEGYGAISGAMRATLGGRVIPGSAVKAIIATPDGVDVETAATTVRARWAIVAVSPIVAQRIALPQGLFAAALGAFAPGDLIKARLGYRRPFWRYEGLSGAMRSTVLSGLATTDTSPQDSGEGRLTVFLGGPEARRLAAQPSAGRKALLVERLAAVFGPEARMPASFDERIWVDDPWSGGGYNAHVRPGPVADAGARLREVEQSITFACAEIADEFMGYVEGALQAGEAAAERVLRLMTRA